MAISRANHIEKLFIFGVLSLLLLIQRGGAYEFKVGGSGRWVVPSDAQSYSRWAEKNRFTIGDTLLFVYPSDKDSVLEVTKEDYANCTTTTPLAKFTDGHTVFKFNQSGPFYFISGNSNNCLNNEKIVIIVLADRSPSPTPTPTSPPNSNQTQTKAPPPPSGGASSAVINILGLFLAFAGSFIVLGL